MPNNTVDAKAICPFYEGCGPVTLRCECAIGGTRLYHAFRDRKERDQHLEKFCMTYDYTECIYCKMLIFGKYYEDEEERQ
jgi:hypothetical protein